MVYSGYSCSQIKPLDGSDMTYGVLTLMGNGKCIDS